MTEKETVTAREDQPRLGTCKFWPFLQHAQDVCCIDWKPATEDQSRLTFGNKIRETIETLRGEAQGEAPQQVSEWNPDVEVYRKLLMEKFSDRCSMEQIASASYILAGAKVVEAGAHPSQDARSGIYVASRASIPARSEMWRELRHGGIKINATWIDEAEENATQSFPELWSRIEREIRSSAGLVLYAESDDFPLKGALVEVGMALAMGIQVIVVAPGVLMNPRNFKPFGSWAKHPLVTFEESLGIACKQAGARFTPSLQETQ